MRISDWSSDVCSSDLVGGDEIDRAKPLTVGDQPVVLRRFGGSVADARALEPGLLRQQRRRAFETFAREAAHFDAAQLGIFGAGDRAGARFAGGGDAFAEDRKSTRLNSSH